MNDTTTRIRCGKCSGTGMANRHAPCRVCKGTRVKPAAKVGK